MPTVPIFRLLNADAVCKELLGTPVRVYAFGRAPKGVARPYVVWQEVTGAPGNTLGCRPGYDQYNIQVDVYGNDEITVEKVKDRIKDLVEDQTETSIEAWYGGSFEHETDLNRFSFLVSWYVKR